MKVWNEHKKTINGKVKKLLKQLGMEWESAYNLYTQKIINAEDIYDASWYYKSESSFIKFLDELLELQIRDGKK